MNRNDSFGTYLGFSKLQARNGEWPKELAKLSCISFILLGLHLAYWPFWFKRDSPPSHSKLILQQGTLETQVMNTLADDTGRSFGERAEDGRWKAPVCSRTKWLLKSFSWADERMPSLDGLKVIDTTTVREWLPCLIFRMLVEEKTIIWTFPWGYSSIIFDKRRVFIDHWDLTP